MPYEQNDTTYVSSLLMSTTFCRDDSLKRKGASAAGWVNSRVHGEAGVVGGLDAVRLLVGLEHLAGVPAV